MPSLFAEFKEGEGVHPEQGRWIGACLHLHQLSSEVSIARSALLETS